MTNTKFNQIANRNRKQLFAGYLFGAAFAIVYIAQALALPL